MKRSITLVIAILCVLSFTLEAQENKNAREGFWIGFGLGAGSATLAGDIEDADRETGASGYLRLGGTLSQKLLIGGESMAWVKTVDDVDITIGSLAGVVVFYPSPTGSFYLKGGIGFLSIDFDGEESGSGVAVSLGLGNEFRVGNNFSVVLFLNSIASSGVEVVGIDVDPNFVQVGVGVGWH